MKSLRWFPAIAAILLVPASPPAVWTQPSANDIVGGSLSAVFACGSPAQTAFLYEVPSTARLVLTDICWSPAGPAVTAEPEQWSATVRIEDAQVRWLGASRNGGVGESSTWPLSEHFSTGIVFAPGASVYMKLQGSSPSPANINYTLTWSGYLVPSTASSALDRDAADDLALRAFPNPAGRRVVLEFRLARPGRASLALFDASGRRIRRVASGSFEAGTHSAEWDGRDDKGREVTAGTYFAKLETPDRARVRSLVHVR